MKKLIRRIFKEATPGIAKRAAFLLLGVGGSGTAVAVTNEQMILSGFIFLISAVGIIWLVSLTPEEERADLIKTISNEILEWFQNAEGSFIEKCYKAGCDVEDVNRMRNGSIALDVVERIRKNIRS